MYYAKDIEIGYWTYVVRVFMIIKKYMLRFFIILLLNGMGLVFGMDAPATQLRPIDKVFLLACEKNTDISFSFKNGANWKSIDPKNGYTGLHYACMNNNLERVKWFLKRIGIF